AKVDAGKVIVRATEFSVEEVFAALRGMLRPMLAASRVELVFEDARKVPSLRSDEAKVTQILRNFLANAVKFTQRGEIRVSARAPAPGETAPGLKVACMSECVLFCVSDTGIGIASSDRERIFEEFSQIENPVQKHVRGTGLGLPLCRKLAAVLGSHVWVDSEL